MRFFLWLLLLLATAIGLAVTARFNPGNVVLFYPPYRIDLSLNFFLLLSTLLFLFLYLMIDAVRSTSAMPARWPPTGATSVSGKATALFARP